jgi:regulatory protein
LSAAAKFLTRRARTESETRAHLAAKDFEPDAIDACVKRLFELRLLDDLGFARSWVAERSARKGLAGDAVVEELIAKGVERDVADTAVREAGLDEFGRAVELVHQHVRRVSHLPVRDQVRRLLAVLGRRGYSQEISFDAVKTVLPPEGWD